MRIRTPDAVRWIARTLEDAGYETWAVGGAVRDAVLGVESADWDLATRATPGAMRKIFRRTVPIGIDHGTVGVIAKDGRMYEVTTFRRDVETDGRHAVVAFSDSIEEDLARRDFTINALAWHPLREELLDPWKGASDLEARTVRTVGRASERFAEDWLRILRAFRFAGRFGFDIDPDTWAAATAGVANLRTLSAERVREEIWKILETGGDPGRALRLYRDAGALAVIAPEIEDRGAGDPDIDTALDRARRLPRSRPLLRWVAWVRDGGASADPTTARGLHAADDRSARASVATVGLMTRLRFSNAQIDRAGRLVAAGRDLPGADAPAETRRRWLSRVGAHLLPDLLRLAGSEVETDLARRELSAAGRHLRGVVASGTPLTVQELSFGGRDLIAAGHRPGPWFGRLLDHLLDRVLADPTLDEADTLAELAGEWIAKHGPGSGPAGAS